MSGGARRRCGLRIRGRCSQAGGRIIQYLYHAIGDGDLDSVLRDGLDDPSYWGTLFTALGYVGDARTVFRVPVERFEASMLAYNEGLAEQIGEGGEDIPPDGTWEESLELMGSVRYDARMRLEPDDLVEVDVAEAAERGFGP